MQSLRSKPVERRRIEFGGFTMVELLMVLAIIGILAALLVPAIQGAMRTARVAAVQSEMESLKAGIQAFKQRFNVDPPSSLTLHESPAGWVADARSKALIKQIWPQFDFTYSQFPGNAIDINRDGDTTDSVPFDGAECLAFFLGGMFDGTSGAPNGFSKNPRSPFAADPGSRDGPYFEFKGGMDPATKKPIGRFVDTDGDSLFEYLDSYPSQTNPYVYFSSYGGTGYRASDNLNRMPKGAYFQDVALKSAYNSNGFQLISPGPDFAYGLGSYFSANDEQWTAKPTTLTVTEQDQRLLEEPDNITNFHTGLLGN